MEENEKLAFLDTAITHHKDDSLTTSVYRKKTHTDKYLSFESHHPIAHKLSVVNTLFSRAEGICTTEKDLENEKKHLKKVLELNGYPKNVLRKNVTRNRTINDGEDQEKPIATVVLPYVGNTSECIKRILAKLKIRTCFKPYKTLRKFLVHPKDRIKKEDHTGVIYQVSCTTCNESYIGQTGRTMGHRIKEHRRALISADAPYSAVAEHAMKTGHEIAWERAKVLDINSNDRQRVNLEAWYIRLKKAEMNRDVGTLSMDYDCLIRLEQKKGI